MRAKALAKRKYEIFWWANILIPLVLGALMYAVLNSPFFFSNLTHALFAKGEESAFAENLFSTICLYGRDFLWAYSIVFAVAFLFRGSFRDLKKAFLIVLAFETVVEILKLLSIIPGSFDLKSLLAVVIGNVIAVVVILIHEKVLL